MAYEPPGGGPIVRSAGLSPARFAATLLGGTGFVVAAASVLLPWVTVPAGAAGPGRPPADVTWTGLEDPSDLGLVVLAAAAIGVGFLLPTVLPRGRWLALVAMVAALGAGVTGWYAMGERPIPTDLVPAPRATVDVDAAIGLQVLLSGVGLAVVGCLAVLVTRRVAVERIAVGPAPDAPAGGAPSAAALESGVPPGWYADPAGGAALRWWTGTRWSHHAAGTTSPSSPGIPPPQDRH